MRPLMTNHARGLWGYTGTTPAGDALTIQSTGLGGPSLAIVLAEFAELGVRHAVRLGTCRALDPGLWLAAPAVVAGALATEGASRELGGAGLTEPDAELTGALAAATGTDPITVAGADLHHDPDPGPPGARLAGRGRAARGPRHGHAAGAGTEPRPAGRECRGGGPGGRWPPGRRRGGAGELARAGARGGGGASRRGRCGSAARLSDPLLIGGQHSLRIGTPPSAARSSATSSRRSSIASRRSERDRRRRSRRSRSAAEGTPTALIALRCASSRALTGPERSRHRLAENRVVEQRLREVADRLLPLGPDAAAIGGL